MTEPRLDIRSFEKAIDRLQEGLDRYQRDTTDTQIRDGLIQRFEYTYELGHKMLKRYLEATSASPEDYDAMPFQDLIRSGNEQGLLLGDWPRWRTFREMRSKTSHSYNEEVACTVVDGIPDFLGEAIHLRDQLRARLA
ncbi:MAG: nucleotidyltransferase [Rhodospirillales bacterium]|nr:MAG: nucleotidyltransferase [Rhodospirillales bacterium]